MCALVAGVSVVAPVEPRFERYTDEFISRLYYAVTPAVAILAAGGASWLWTRGRAGRGAAAAGLLAAVLVADACVAGMDSVTKSDNFSSAAVVYGSDRFDKSLSSSSFGLRTPSGARFIGACFPQKRARAAFRPRR